MRFKIGDRVRVRPGYYDSGRRGWISDSWRRDEHQFLNDLYEMSFYIDEDRREQPYKVDYYEYELVLTLNGLQHLKKRHSL